MHVTFLHQRYRICSCAARQSSSDWWILGERLISHNFVETINYPTSGFVRRSHDCFMSFLSVRNRIVWSQIVHHDAFFVYYVLILYLIAKNLIFTEVFTVQFILSGSYQTYLYV